MFSPLIQTRRSIRRFQEKLVENEKIEIWIEDCSIAPTLIFLASH